MGKEQDDLFAKQCIQLKLLTPAQVMSCREILTELESAGVVKLLAVVAVDQGLLSRANAEKLAAAINTRFPGKHPPLPPAVNAAALPSKKPAAAPKPPPAPRKPAAPETAAEE